MLLLKNDSMSTIYGIFIATVEKHTSFIDGKMVEDVCQFMSSLIIKVISDMQTWHLEPCLIDLGSHVVTPRTSSFRKCFANEIYNEGIPRKLGLYGSTYSAGLIFDEGIVQCN